MKFTLVLNDFETVLQGKLRASKLFAKISRRAELNDAAVLNDYRNNRQRENGLSSPRSMQHSFMKRPTVRITFVIVAINFVFDTRTREFKRSRFVREPP